MELFLLKIVNQDTVGIDPIYTVQKNEISILKSRSILYGMSWWQIEENNKSVNEWTKQ